MENIDEYNLLLLSFDMVYRGANLNNLRLAKENSTFKFVSHIEDNIYQEAANRLLNIIFKEMAKINKTEKFHDFCNSIVELDYKDKNIKYN